MFEVVPLAQKHLTGFDLPDTLPGDLTCPRTLVVEGLGLAVLGHRRELWSGVVLCTGIKPVHAGRAICWTLLGTEVPPRAWGLLIPPLNAMLERAHAQGYRRIEAYVDAASPQGVRWVERFGFTVKALLEQFTEDGRDVFLYQKLARAE